VPDAGVADELARRGPAEVLLPEVRGAGRDPLDETLREQTSAAVTYRAVADFAPPRAETLLREHFETAGLEGFGFDGIDLSLQAAGGLLAYVQETQRAAARHIRRRADSI
jgi:DNA mismatch repair protein MutS